MSFPIPVDSTLIYEEVKQVGNVRILIHLLKVECSYPFGVKFFLLEDIENRDLVETLFQNAETVQANNTAEAIRAAVARMDETYGCYQAAALERAFSEVQQ